VFANSPQAAGKDLLIDAAMITATAMQHSRWHC
jgi:hypothetical protein